jgi:hypothetical protein
MYAKSKQLAGLVILMTESKQLAVLVILMTTVTSSILKVAKLHPNGVTSTFNMENI